MTNAPGAEIVLLIKQNGDGTRGSVRTTTPAVSAHDIAATFGGVWLVRRFDKEKFYTLVYAMTFLIGSKLIADSLM